MFTTAVVNQNGQIVIPAKIRKQYGIAPHGSVEIVSKEDCMEIRPIHAHKALPFMKKKKSEIFSFAPQNPQKNLSKQVDDILYS